jgi:hypothetical protein
MAPSSIGKGPGAEDPPGPPYKEPYPVRIEAPRRLELVWARVIATSNRSSLRPADPLFVLNKPYKDGKTADPQQVVNRTSTG